jgi:hypothetical protein
VSIHRLAHKCWTVVGLDGQSVDTGDGEPHFDRLAEAIDFARHLHDGEYRATEQTSHCWIAECDDCNEVYCEDWAYHAQTGHELLKLLVIDEVEDVSWVETEAGLLCDLCKRLPEHEGVEPVPAPATPGPGQVSLDTLADAT